MEGGELIHRTALFYADNHLVAPTDPDWMQGTFYTLAELFSRVGIWKNVVKTVGMLCLLCHMVGTQS